MITQCLPPFLTFAIPRSVAMLASNWASTWTLALASLAHLSLSWYRLRSSSLSLSRLSASSRHLFCPSSWNATFDTAMAHAASGRLLAVCTPGAPLNGGTTTDLLLLDPPKSEDPIEPERLKGSVGFVSGGVACC